MFCKEFFSRDNRFLSTMILIGSIVVCNICNYSYATTNTKDLKVYFRIYDSTEKFKNQIVKHVQNLDLECENYGTSQSSTDSSLQNPNANTNTSAADYNNSLSLLSPVPNYNSTGSASQTNVQNQIAINVGGNNNSTINNPNYGTNNNTIQYSPGTMTSSNSMIILDQIINLGSYAWSVISASRPSANFQAYRAHALPKGVTCWTELENWQIPKSKVFTAEYKNFWGKVIAQYSYRISFVYGGTYEGKGKYISNLTITPVQIKVSWPYDFSSQIQIPGVFNLSKKSDPLAGMQLFVYWNLSSSAGGSKQNSSAFFIAGDGRLQVSK